MLINAVITELSMIIVSNIFSDLGPGNYLQLPETNSDDQSLYFFKEFELFL